jgi:AcrR family transcriptional regulator
MSTTASTRRSAAERRAEIVTAAIRHFARSGYNAASTDAIARDAGISQPYLFRLFGTKRDLFLACHDRMHDRIVETFTTAAEGLPVEDRLPAMGHAYMDLLADRDTLLFQMQSYAACADADIQAQVRRRYVELVRLVQELGEAEPAQLWSFFSAGMLLNVVASLDLEVVASEEHWAACWLDPKQLPVIDPPVAGG